LLEKLGEPPSFLIGINTALSVAMGESIALCHALVHIKLCTEKSADVQESECRNPPPGLKPITRVNQKVNSCYAKGKKHP
jgi:hypothetical protein